MPRWSSGRISGFSLLSSLHLKVPGSIPGGTLFFSVGRKLVGSLLYSGGQYYRKWGFWKIYGCDTCYHSVFRKQLAILWLFRPMLLYSFLKECMLVLESLFLCGGKSSAFANSQNKDFRLTSLLKVWRTTTNLAISLLSSLLLILHHIPLPLPASPPSFWPSVSLSPLACLSCSQPPLCLPPVPPDEYVGDSYQNALGDILCATLGYWSCVGFGYLHTAYIAPIFFFNMELLLLRLYQDGLIIMIIQLIFFTKPIADWQKLFVEVERELARLG